MSRRGSDPKHYVYSSEPGTLDLENRALEDQRQAARADGFSERTLRKRPQANLCPKANVSSCSDAPVSPEQRRTSKKSGASQSKVKEEEPSANISSLSSSSRLQSPTIAAVTEDANAVPGTPGSSSSSLQSHQPPPAPAIPQYQTFGPDPLTFDDPTIYHIREVKPGMSEEEIKEIYSVSQYPHDDLRHLVPGTPPDKDFSNAKPANQVSANTFNTYIEPYLRPLTEEDMAFLKERVCTKFFDDNNARPLISSRVIVLNPLLCRVEVNDITPRSGQKRMGPCPRTCNSRTATDFQPTNLGEVWNR